MKLTDFESKALEKIKEIPEGKVSSYKKLARAIGFPEAARAVGNALHKNPRLIRVPCHRIVKNDGSLGGYAGGAKKKTALLKKEGVRFEGGKIINFKENLYRFR